MMNQVKHPPENGTKHLIRRFIYRREWTFFVRRQRDLVHAELADVIPLGYAGGVAEKAAAFVQAMAEVAGVGTAGTRAGAGRRHGGDIPALAGLRSNSALLGNNPRDVTLADATRPLRRGVLTLWAPRTPPLRRLRATPGGVSCPG